MGVKRAWQPEGFDKYLKHFPNTPALMLPDSLNLTNLFCDHWNLGSHNLEKYLCGMSKNITDILVRGYLGSYMLNNLKAPLNVLKKLGFDAIIMKQTAGGSHKQNVRMMLQQLELRQNRDHFIFCAHSRGGLECLKLLSENESIRIKTKALIMSQTAHGPSYILESIIKGAHQEKNYSRYRALVENIQWAALMAFRAKKGGEELTSSIWPNLVEAVEKQPFNFPVMQTASWSAQPTLWLDSFHERLQEIRPGFAHDGQFFLGDLIWRNFKHVLLPNLDHAQPVVGGFNFDHNKYWLTLISMALLSSF